MAERVGFEPTLEFPLNTLSKRAPSTTRPSLRSGKKRQLAVHKLRPRSLYQDIMPPPRLRMEYGEFHDTYPSGAAGGGVRDGWMRPEEGYAHPRILLCRQSRQPVGGGGQSGELPRSTTGQTLRVCSSDLRRPRRLDAAGRRLRASPDIALSPIKAAGRWRRSIWRASAFNDRSDPNSVV